ncbi:hypothetical protein [uncultured Nostoc sp.]|uniref:hypothetical protein n=1 Tax=uncultured Nostoc sp. TaxID=340711 RepID=UPI0035CA6842
MSNTALYKKLSGVQLNVSQALVRETVSELRSLISSMAGEQPNSLSAYKLRIIDGTARLLDTYQNTQNKS